MKDVIFSGIQPTGKITLGNYLGVIKQWLLYQKNTTLYNCYFTIADLHALTNLKENKNSFLYNLVLDTLALYLACGIDYKKSTIFLQSQVSEHTQLNWILNCFTSVGELKNMIQFKKKNKEIKTNLLNQKLNNAAILNYPILMASDILLYNTNYVPVGFDQKQHLELTQKIAKRFNRTYKVDIFNIPLPIFSNTCEKIMSLTNPLIKMSKSDNNDNSFISILDSYTNYSRKIMNAVTDNDNPSKIYYDPLKKPGISNLLNILSGITNIEKPILEKKFYNYMYKDFKLVIIDNLKFHFSKIKKRFYFYRKKENFLEKILLEGSYKARRRAIAMITKIKSILGLK